MKITIDGGHVIEGKPEELKEYFELMGVEFPLKAEEEKEAVEEETPTFSVGDRVKVLAKGEFGGVGVGEIGTVAVSRALEGDEYNVKVDSEDDHDYFRPQDLELVTEEEKPYKPSEGDIVVITANTNFSRNKVGDIGKVGEVNPAGTAKVDVPDKPSTLDSNGNWTKFSEMRPATEGEKARYEKALKVAKESEKLAKIGRKPGEIKEGDIVRGERYSDSSAKFLGIVEDISGSMIGVRSGDSRYHAAEKAKSELIAPVESRVDTE